MSVIVLDGEALDDFVEKIVIQIKNQLNAKPRDKWIDGEEAMTFLRIKSKTTLQKLRDEGKFGFRNRSHASFYTTATA